MQLIESTRLKEMYKAFAELGQVEKVEDIPFAGGSHSLTTVKLAVTMPEILIALGIARTEEEAQVFLSHVIAGVVTAVATGDLEAMDMPYDLMKIGFQLGIAAGRKEGSN